MAKYKLHGNGVKDTETGACIPNDALNRDWQKYLVWLAVPNTPAPEFTQAELDAQAIKDEIFQLKQDLKDALAWEFRMISAIWETGKTKGLWVNADVTDTTLKQKYADWQTKLDRLAQLGE